MTKEEALLKLAEIKKDAGDIETDHGKADQVLCELLESLGYSEVVKAYDEIEKWYA